MQGLKPLAQVGDLPDGGDNVGWEQGAGGEGQNGQRAPFVLGQRADTEPVEDIGVVGSLPGQ